MQTKEKARVGPFFSCIHIMEIGIAIEVHDEATGKGQGFALTLVYIQYIQFVSRTCAQSMP